MKSWSSLVYCVWKIYMDPTVGSSNPEPEINLVFVGSHISSHSPMCFEEDRRLKPTNCTSLNCPQLTSNHALLTGKSGGNMKNMKRIIIFFFFWDASSRTGSSNQWIWVSRSEWSSQIRLSLLVTWLEQLPKTSALALYQLLWVVSYSNSSVENGFPQAASGNCENKDR